MSAILDVPLYSVIVRDCEQTTFRQAFDAVYNVFSLSTERANAVVHEINDNGFSNIGSFTHEIADTYVDDMKRYTEAFGFVLDADIDYGDLEIDFIPNDEDEE